MDTNSILLFMDLLPIIFLGIYGYRFKYKMPDFGANGGLMTPYTKASRRAWKYGHKVAGSICLGVAIASAVLMVAKYLFYNAFPQYANSALIDMIVLGIQFACVLLIIPVTNRMIKKKYGDLDTIVKNEKKRQAKEKKDEQES